MSRRRKDDDLILGHIRTTELVGIAIEIAQMSVRKSLFTMTDGIPAHYLRNFYRDAYELVRSYMP